VVCPVNIMTDLELFETGEGVIAGSDHPPFSALGVSMILELHSLLPTAGEDSLRAAMRIFFGATFTNQEGLTGEIGRVIGKGRPIPARVLGEAESHRPAVKFQLKSVLRRMLEELPQRGGQ
jgi:hypothetical protein